LTLKKKMRILKEANKNDNIDDLIHAFHNSSEKSNNFINKLLLLLLLINLRHL